MGGGRRGAALSIFVYLLTSCCVLGVCAQKEGAVRLVDGPGQASGRVEVYHDRGWRTVCSDGFDNYAAEVVCSQLGLFGGWPVGGGFFLPGEGVVWLSQYECFGNERRLVDCSGATFKENGCSHLQDAGVICESDLQIMIDEGEIRLGGGNNPMEGYVEIRHAGVWGHICDADWGDAESTVVCREMGYFRGVPAKNYFFNTRPTRFWLDEVICDGTEDRFMACARGRWGRYACQFGGVATVVCEDYKTGTLLEDVRLVGSYVGHRGRVEVKVDGEWGTVCDQGWDDKDARVVCFQLGYYDGGITAPRGNYGKGTGVVWLSDLQCIGDEVNLSQCTHAQYGRNQCTHNMDATVMCHPRREQLIDEVL